MSAVERTEAMTLETFIRLYETEGAFELMDGEIIPLMPPVVLHGWIIRILFRLLDEHARVNTLGEVFTELPFAEVYSADWVKNSLVPDVMFFAKAKWDHYVAETDDWKSKPFLIAPDLAVEVVSKHDSYLKFGVELVWVVDAHHSRVTVYRGNHYSTQHEVLTGEDVLPGLEIKLPDLFN
jgi:Uma2 family endonuclease